MKLNFERVDMNVLFRAFGLLSRNDQRKVRRITLAQVLVSMLDLIGIITLGLLASIVTNFEQNNQANSNLILALDFVGLSKLSRGDQILILGFLVVLLLVGRTLISVLLTRKILFYFSRMSAKISSEVISQVLAEPISKLKIRTTQEILFSVTRGVEIIIVNVLATALVLVADFSLLVVLVIGLFILDPVTSICFGTIFAFFGLVVKNLTSKRGSHFGLEATEIAVASNEKIIEAIDSYREIFVRNRRSYYVTQLSKQRNKLAELMAEMYFMPFISKFVIEVGVVIGAVVLAASQFIYRDLDQAALSLTIFLAAGSRLAPAILRVQQGLIQIRSGSDMASSTITFLDSLDLVKGEDSLEISPSYKYQDFISNIRLSNVSFKYDSESDYVIDRVSLEIPAGSLVAVVGPSGAGKSTLIDLILGILSPISGEIRISEHQPLEAIRKWPGAIAYVPQEVNVIKGTYRENISLGYDQMPSTDDNYLRALRIANLESVVQHLPFGIDSQVGERGVGLSGGQRQRIGIARAMYSNPKLIVLDEATSSLDGESEHIISNQIRNLKGSTTVLMIAHRLSSIRKADFVIYMEAGKVLAVGTFDEVRRLVPNFDLQAKLMGL